MQQDFYFQFKIVFIYTLNTLRRFKHEVQHGLKTA